jgi:hypothetical protein
MNGRSTAEAFCLVLSVVLFFADPSIGRVLHVPEDYLTLQEAVYQTQDRDTVLVGTGEFAGCQVFAGPDVGDFVTILGSGWPNGTIITGYFENEEMNAIELRGTRGWRITNCEFTNCGDAINVGEDWKCRIDNNYIHDLSLSYWPCGIEGQFVESRVHHNLFVNCFAGLMLWGVNADQEGNWIYNNTFDGMDYEGVQFREGSPVGCLVTNNIFFNHGGQAVEFAICEQGDCEVSYNLVWETDGPWENVTPGEGNLYESPMFTLENSIPEYYFLNEESPCIDTGNPLAFFTDPDASRADIGAFPAQDRPIVLEIGFVTALPGTEVEVPVFIGHVLGAEVVGCEFVINYPAANLELNDVLIPDGSPTDNANWSLSPTIIPGRVTVEMGGQAELPTDGTLCVLSFTVSPDVGPGENMPITFESAFVNDGALIPVTIDGGVQPPQDALFGDVNITGTVRLNDVDLLFNYLAGMLDLSAYQRWLADVSGVMGITAYDGALIVKYVQGLIPAFPVNGGEVDMFAAGRIELEDEIAKAGETFVYPLNLVNGINVSSMQASINLSGCPVELTGVINPSEGVWFSRIGGTYPNYSIFLGGSGTLNGNSTVCQLEFAVPAEAAGDTFAVACSSVMLNEVAIPTASSGRIAVVDTTEAMSNGESETPHEFAMLPSYPNPFNAETTLRFSLASQQPVDLNIYNSLGQLVQELESKTLPAGEYSYHWNASQMSSGLYIAVLSTPAFQAQQKMVLIK